MTPGLNYVAPLPDGGFEVVIGGQQVGVYADQGEAEAAFNQTLGSQAQVRAPSERSGPAIGGKGPSRWASLMTSLAPNYGVPIDIGMAVLDIESSGNPNAKSEAGALGLMQVMPGHFQPGENPLDPTTNVSRGLEILAHNFSIFGNWDSAAAAYFGAVDAQGRPTTEADVNGVTGIEYAQRFRNARTRYAPPWP